MANFLATFEEGHIEVGDSPGPHFPLLNEASHLFPGILEVHSREVWPVKLVEIDPFDTQAPKRGVALLADGVRTQASAGLTEYVRVGPTQAAFGEYERSLTGGYTFKRMPNYLLGMAPSVNRCSIDPVHPQDRKSTRLNSSHLGI